MSMTTHPIAAAAVLLTLTAGPVFGADTVPDRASQLVVTLAPDPADLEKQLAGWPERPRLGARQIIAKYGAPQLVTSEMLVWIKPGNYKRITVTKSEDHHDFPLPHMDYLEVTVDYKVPADKADEMMKFDGSVTFDKTRGEMSARCDLEGHSVLSLNLAHDVATGKKTAEEARKAFGEMVGEDMAGKYPPYTTALRFEPNATPADTDKPSIPGAPKRAMNAATGAQGELKPTKVSGDAEILSILLAVDTNEVVAAMEAAKKKLSPAIAEYAKMLHTEHGKHAGATMKLAQNMDVTPADTDKVNALRVQGAGALAGLVPLSDDEFGAAYLDAKIKGHTEVLATIDGELLKTAEHEALKKHLTAMREHVAMHLEEAKELLGTAKATAGQP